MKKSLLAVAAMTAFAGAAQAQSSVTVYGILDVGYVGSNYSGTSITANAANTNNAAAVGAVGIKQNTAGFGQSAESTSRIGFKGNEDLGGGMSAVFTLELGLSPNSSGAATSGAPANSATTATALNSTLVSTPAVFGQINRQAFVGLKKNGLGTVTIGTQYTPMFDVQSATDAAGNNNLVGNAVYSGNLQASTGSFNMGSAPYGGAVANQSLNVDTGAYTTRTSNALKLQSDRFSGFAGQLFYAQANQNTTQTGANFAAGTTGGTNNNTAWGLNADYVWNKLQVVAAYQNIKNQDVGPVSATGAAYAVTTTAYAAGTADSFGTNSTDNQTYAAATYDFGILKAYYQFVTRKVTSTFDGSYSTKRTGNQIGVKSQLTPVISAYATYGMTNAAYFGQGLPAANGRTFQVGVDYFLSKRTNLYVAGGAVNQSSNGSTSAATTGATGVSANNYAVGVRHTF
jgi:predicted porin